MSDAPEGHQLRVHVEVCLRTPSSYHPPTNHDAVRAHVLHLVRSHLFSLSQSRVPPRSDCVPFDHVTALKDCVHSIRLCEKSESGNIFMYSTCEEDDISVLDAEDDCENTAITTTATTLPSPHLEGLWESLVFEDDLLGKLLNYVSTSILFADKCIDPNIISFNKVVLLHGPPGTGKTSLCRALAQKLSIRLSDRYPIVRLVEINSHSLFSKFFSESGKMVMKMFQSIKDLCDNSDTFICVLIDEVESLTAARKAAVSGMEPSDAIRVVNALLTQIDSLKRKKNVLILTTSNITEAIDLAFVDRADLKLHVGLPTQLVIYAMLTSTLTELLRCRLISHESPDNPFLDWRNIKVFVENDCMDETSYSWRVYEIAGACAGLSGRAIRKMPFIAHALFIKTSQPVSLEKYLDALELAVDEEHSARKAM
ncbi:Pachytene checkpoint protein 2 [Chytriomyces hyalinus]|nr:Pachytene checkpoint protein 2 [Chytriomyces hyalinus]